LGECRLASAKRIPAKEQLMIGMGTMNKLIQKDYAEQLGEIKQRIRSAQYEALKAVNQEKLPPLVAEIGRAYIG
jgi:hypothetical protein